MTAGQAVRTALATGRWAVDVAASHAGFSVRNFGFRHVHGSFAVTEGSVDVSPGGHPIRVEARLDVSTVSTGNSRRDGDLCGHRFLDVERAPELTFVATSVTETDDGWSVTGALTVRGGRAPVTLAVRPVSLDEDAARVTAQGVLDLRTTPIRAPRVLVGRYVEITVDAVLRRRPIPA